MKSRFFCDSLRVSTASTKIDYMRSAHGRFGKLFAALKADRIECAKQCADQAEASTNQELCSICLSPAINTASIDSCSHMYCFVCISLWGKVNPTCPNCKKLFKIVQSVQHHQLEYFEPPISEESGRDDDADYDDDDDDDDDDDHDGDDTDLPFENSETPLEEAPPLVARERHSDSDSSGYSYDGGFVCDDDEIDYESSVSNELPEMDPFDSNSDSETEYESSQRSRRKELIARRRRSGRPEAIRTRRRKRRRIDGDEGGERDIAAAAELIIPRGQPDFEKFALCEQDCRVGVKGKSQDLKFKTQN